MKPQIKSMDDLSRYISNLEEKEFLLTEKLKSQASLVKEHFKPSSMFKSAVQRFTTSKTLKQNAIDTSLGVGAGWLIRKIYEANSKSIFRKLAGSIIQNITTGILTRKMPAIREKLTGAH